MGCFVAHPLASWECQECRHRSSALDQVVTLERDVCNKTFPAPPAALAGEKDAGVSPAGLPERAVAPGAFPHLQRRWNQTRDRCHRDRRQAGRVTMLKMKRQKK